jgi:calcium-dependent protein kinase
MLKKGFDRRREDELQKAFTDADKNKDGYLSMDEYCDVFHAHGIDISRDEAMLFFNSKDRDRDGRISYEEFCDRETVSERAFKAMDVNGDGFVSKSEMLKASNRGARRLSAADVDACFREYDRDGDNRLNYDEFCVMMNAKKSSVTVLLQSHKEFVVKNSTKSAPDNDAASVSTTDTQLSAAPSGACRRRSSEPATK